MVADLAPGYAADRNIGNLLTAILAASASSRQPQALQGLVKQPTEYVVGCLRALGVTPVELTPEPDGSCYADFEGMGQVLFDPPSVGGWPQNCVLALRLRPRWPAGSSPTVWPAEPTSRRCPTRPRPIASMPRPQLLTVPRWASATAGALQRSAADPPTLVTLALVSPEYVSN